MRRPETGDSDIRVDPDVDQPPTTGREDDTEEE